MLKTLYQITKTLSTNHITGTYIGTVYAELSSQSLLLIFHRAKLIKANIVKVIKLVIVASETMGIKRVRSKIEQITNIVEKIGVLVFSLTDQNIFKIQPFVLIQ